LTGVQAAEDDFDWAAAAGGEAPSPVKATAPRKAAAAPELKAQLQQLPKPDAEDGRQRGCDGD
jgi:hypothetical protein